jgi:hypothetical protein
VGIEAPCADTNAERRAWSVGRDLQGCQSECFLDDIVGGNVARLRVTVLCFTIEQRSGLGEGLAVSAGKHLPPRDMGKEA